MRNKEYGHFALRVVLGSLFLFTGIGKLLNPDGPIGMLTGLGFPLPVFFAWILLLSEIVFGASVLVGWKTTYTVWPLIIVLLVATFTVTIPGNNTVNVLFHLLGIVALWNIYLEGPGALSISKK